MSSVESRNIALLQTIVCSFYLVLKGSRLKSPAQYMRNHLAERGDLLGTKAFLALFLTDLSIF